MKYEKSCGTIIVNQDKILLIGAKDDDGGDVLVVSKRASRKQRN